VKDRMDDIEKSLGVGDNSCIPAAATCRKLPAEEKFVKVVSSGRKSPRRAVVSVNLPLPQLDKRFT
jgi:hypothetical protein